MGLSCNNTYSKPPFPLSPLPLPLVIAGLHTNSLGKRSVHWDPLLWGIGDRCRKKKSNQYPIRLSRVSNGRCVYKNFIINPLGTSKWKWNLKNPLGDQCGHKFQMNTPRHPKHAKPVLRSPGRWLIYSCVTFIRI